MLLRLAITAIILAILAMGIDMRESARAMAAIDLRYLALVLGLVAIDRAVMILRWMLLLRARGIPITTGDAIRLFLISSFVGSFLPAGVGADAARAYGLSRDAATGSDAIASVAVDRLLGILSLFLMAFIGLLLWPANQRSWHLPVMVGLFAGGSLGLLWADVVLRWIVPANRREGFIARRALKLVDAVGRYRGHRGVLIHVLFWSLVVQLLRITQAYLLGLGLGFTVSYGYFLLFMPLALLLLLLPVSVSGFGLPQGGIVWMLSPYEPADRAFALSTLIVLTGLAGNLPGFWLWLRHRREIL